MNLLETIIYLSIFGLMISGVLATGAKLIYINTSFDRQQLETEEINFLSNKIGWLIRGADDINIRSPDQLEFNQSGRHYVLNLDRTRQAILLNNLQLNTRDLPITALQISTSGSNALKIKLTTKRETYSLNYLTPT